MLTAITAFGYPIVIQYKRGGFWWVLAIPGVLVWLIDVIANYTEWAIVFGWPAKGDHTITNRLKTMLVSDPFESRRAFALGVLTVLDACEPDGKH